MKFLLKIGDQLDLNVAYNGGAADSNLIYTTPEDNGVVDVDINTGVVEALGVGDTVVRVFHNSNPSLLLATLIFEVCLASQYADLVAIREGENSVVVNSAVVPNAPAITRFSPLGLTAIEQNGYKVTIAGAYWNGGSFSSTNWPEERALWVFDENQNSAVGLENLMWVEFGIVLPQAKKFKRVEISFGQKTPPVTVTVSGINGKIGRAHV